MTHTKYQKYVFGLKSSHLKIGANGAGAYIIPRSVSYPGVLVSWYPGILATRPGILVSWYPGHQPWYPGGAPVSRLVTLQGVD